MSQMAREGMQTTFVTTLEQRMNNGSFVCRKYTANHGGNGLRSQVLNWELGNLFWKGCSINVAAFCPICQVRNTSDVLEFCCSGTYLVSVIPDRVAFGLIPIKGFRSGRGKVDPVPRGCSFAFQVVSTTSDCDHALHSPKLYNFPVMLWPVNVCLSYTRPLYLPMQTNLNELYWVRWTRARAFQTSLPMRIAISWSPTYREMDWGKL